MGGPLKKGTRSSQKRSHNNQGHKVFRASSKAIAGSALSLTPRREKGPTVNVGGKAVSGNTKNTEYIDYRATIKITKEYSI